MTLRIEKAADRHKTIIRLSGRLQCEHLDELRMQIDGEQAPVAMDLEDVTLVDIEVVQFLDVYEKRGVELRYCRPYIREWMRRENDRERQRTEASITKINVYRNDPCRNRMRRPVPHRSEDVSETTCPDDGRTHNRRFNMADSRSNMKIVVIGGSGLIGSKLVKKLREQGHEVVAASPNSGVNTVTGAGLAEVLKGASVVIDVSNSPSWEDTAVLKFFETSTRNLLAHEAAAGVGHHVALSVVGTDRLSESGYFRAKIAQEKLIKGSPIPYSIVQATQFFEFLKGLADISFDGDRIRLPHVLFQPMAADDVASAVGKIAVGPPLNGTVEIGSPEEFRLDELVRRRLAALKDYREVVADPKALYSGAKIREKTLVPGNNARLGETHFEAWLSRSAA